MKNKNILLDTNAFIYLMRNEKECSNTISLENRQINESKFYDECKNANYLFITSQTLYEIFWQSIKKTKKIDQFAYYYDQIIKFKNKYNVKFSILNDTDGEFELRLFEDQYKDNKVDINHFIERKREYEVKKINELLIKVCFSITEFLAEYYGILLLRNFYYVAGVICEIKLNEIYSNYYDSSSDELLNFYKKSFKEEVLVESKELYEACENGNQDINKVVSSLRKYVIRSSTRCTPFGLNAAVVRGKFSNFNDFKVDTKKFKKEPFIDYQWYVNLINLLEWNLGDNLLVTLNNTIEINNDVVLNNWLDSYKYNKKNAINVFLNNTNALKIIIRKTNRKFISIKELKSCLKYQYPNIDQNTLDAFFKDLMNNQVLISNLKGNTIIDNKLEDLIIKLKNYNVDSKIIENINEIVQLLKQYKNTKINAGENTYLKIISKMKNIVKSENYICVNLYNDSVPKLNYEIKDSIKDYVDLLIRFSDKNGYENNYYDNFIDKFGNQAVNVNIVFDDTLGIGYPSKKKLNKTKNFYLLQEFLFNHFGDIIIDDLIPYLDEGNQGDLLGNELSLNIVGSSLKNYLVCNPLLGSNQNYKILGRFHKYENEYILDNEKKDIVEIVYFPKQSKIGNILNCHTNAKYYFEYGTNCEIKGKERVNLEDIYIMPSEKKLKFINKKTSNYITFVVSNMVNIAFMPPILQSLLIISENGTSNLFNFFSMLNVIFKNHKIKPQIKYKNIIIQAKNLTITNEDSLKYNLNIIKKEFNNKLVLCGNEDNYILLNLNKKNNIDILNQLLKTEKKLNIRESFCEYNNFYIKDEFDKSYFSELVFEVESNKNQEEKEIIHVPEYSLNSNYLKEIVYGYLLNYI